MAETFKGPYIITKVNENGTIKMKTKYAKHDQLVNQNQLVKYKQPAVEPKMEFENENKEDQPVKRAYIKKVYPGREDGGPVTRSKNHPVNDLNEVGGAPKKCKHLAKINLITAEQLKDPTQTFEILIKKVASKEDLERRLRLANFSKEIIQQLNSEQLTSLQESLKTEATLWKQSFKFIQKESHQIGPSYISDKFGLPEQTKEEPCWVHNRRQFLELLPPAERNILLTGDPDQRFDPFSYIWCYSYPEIAAQNPALQEHFQHILQFEDNFEGENLDNAHLEDQPIPNQIEEPTQPQPQQPARRGKPPKQKEEDPEYKPRSVTSIPDPKSIARRTRARRPDEFPHQPFGVLDSIYAIGSFQD